MISKILNHVDFEQVNVLLEGFNKSTGFVTAILDLDGAILSKSGWRRICTDFHRVNPTTALNCFVSDTVLQDKEKAGEKYYFYQCLNGLIDVRLPIIIKGEHVANLFSGQFFFEKPDVSFFREQARKYGFEEKAYLDALEKVPVVSKENVKTAMDFLQNITQLIIELTVDKMAQLEINEVIKQNEIALKKNEHAIRQSEERFQLLFNKAPLGYQSLDSDGRFIEVNQQWLDTLGYCKEEVIGRWFGEFLCPEYVDAFRQRFPIFKAQGYIHSEFEMLNKNGQRQFIAFDGKVGYGADGEFKQTHCILQDITRQRKAEEALHKSEERFRIAQEISPDGFTILHPVRNETGEIIDFIFVFENQAIARINQTDPKKITGERLLNLFPTHNGTSVYQAYVRVANTGKPEIIEEIYVGEIISRPTWLRLVIVSMSDDIAVLAQDITERKLSEEALRESQALLLAAFSNSQAGIAIADAPDGKLRYVNDAGLLIRNKSEDDIVKNVDVHNYVSTWQLFHDDGTPMADDEVPLARAVLYGESCSDEFIIRRDNCEDRYVFANASPIKDSNNNIKAGVVVFLDITEKRQIEEKIKQQNELFASLLKLLPVGVFMVDAADGKPLIINEMGKTLLGAGILPDANEHNLSVVYKAYKKGSRKHYPVDEMPITLGMKGISAHIDDMVVERPDGTQILLEVFGTPVQDHQGKTWASLVTFMDITERVRHEEERLAEELKFRHQQRLESIGTLASGVAHEINNPIMGIINYAQLIIDENAVNSTSQYAQEIILEGKRIAEITHNLLFYSRQQKQAHSPADINDIIRRTLSLINGILKKNQIEVRIVTSDSLPSIKCRSQQIQQILMNLLTNARDALNERYHGSDPDKIIQISTHLFEEQNHRWIRITVEDHGNGIPEEIQDRLFDPFFTTKAREIGTGLGLPISYGLAKDHHGRLEFETVEKQYTRFHLTLPVDNGWDIEGEKE